MFDKQVPRLDGLFALSQTPGLDVRPTLLRVLTDLFVDAARRSQDEVERFRELALHLIEQVDEETRLVVAGKLGPCRFAPRAVLDKLLVSEPEVAAEVVAVSPLISGEDQWAFATEGGPLIAAAIARRSDITAELTRFLARVGNPAIAQALALNPAADMSRETIALLSPLAATLPGLADGMANHAGVEPEWLAPVFLSLSPARRGIVTDAFCAPEQSTRPLAREATVSAPQLMLDALEAAALARDTPALAGGLAQIFDMDAETAMRVVGDEGGEPLAVVLAAAGMPPEQAARVLIFSNGQPGTSYALTRRLMDLMQALPRNAATRLARLFTGTSAEARSSRHEPAFAEARLSRPTGKASVQRGASPALDKTRPG